MLRGGTDNNSPMQAGLIVLVGLAAKNATMIVEFAKQAQEERDCSPVDAGKLRSRPILMTTFALIQAVLPLLASTGPGSEMRQAPGTAVLFGVSGVTLLGGFFTPVFHAAVKSVFAGSREVETPA